jgi:hypothetical protein
LFASAEVRIVSFRFLTTYVEAQAASSFVMSASPTPSNSGSQKPPLSFFVMSGY